MDDHSIESSAALVSVVDGDSPSDLPPYPQLLMEASVTELFNGDVELSRQLWQRLVDYQRRLLGDSFKRMGKRWLKGLGQIAVRDDGDFETRQSALIWCLNILGKQSLLSVCFTADHLANLYQEAGDADQAQLQADLSLRITSSFELQDERDPSHFHTNPVPITANTNGAKLSVYRFMPDGTLVTEYSSQATDETLPLDHSSPFTLQTDIDLPVHRLELFEQIGNELFAGDPEAAKSRWLNFVSAHTKLTRDYVHRLLSASHFAGAGLTSTSSLDDPLRAQVLKRLQALRDIYFRISSRIYLRLAEIYASAQSLAEAKESLRHCYDLADLARTCIAPFAELVADQDEGEPPAPTSLSPQVDFVESYLKQIEALTSWEIHLTGLLAQEPIDAAAVTAFAEKISNEFSSASQAVQHNLSGTLLQIFGRIKRHRSKLDRLNKRNELLGLSWALYYINKALRNRLSYNHEEHEFHDCYEFHNSIRLESSIYSIPEIRDDLISAVQRARTIGHNLLDDSRFLEKLERQPRFTNFFYSRLGEICRAHYEHECAADLELREILEEGVSCFLRCLTSRESPIEAHKFFLYPRLAECLSVLGRYTEAIENYKLHLELEQASRTSKWESAKLIAMCYLDIAHEIKSDEVHGGIDVSQYYAEAESWLMEAAQLWEAGVDITNSKCSEVRNAQLHYHLAMLYSTSGEHAQATQQIRWALEWTTHERFASQEYQSYRDLLTYMLAESLAKQDQIDEAVKIVEKLREQGVAPAHLQKTLLFLKKLYVLQQDEEAVRTTTEFLLNTAQPEHEHSIPLTESDHQIFLSFAEMTEYVTRCRKLLEAGEVRTLVHELPTLVAASKSLWFSRQPDPVLLELLASAYMEIGQFDTALVHLRNALAADSSDKNQGICWLKIGELRKRQGQLSEAAKAFEHSYTFGNNLGALLMAANAHRRAGNYAKSLEYLEKIRNSGADKSRTKTNTEAALTLWARYCDSTPGVGGDENDVLRACKYLEDILRGVYGPAGDRVAAFQLVSMIQHPEARELVINLLRKGPLPTQLVILNKLTFLHIHDEDFIEAAIRLLPRKVDPEKRHLSYRAVAKYITATWIESYLTKDRNRLARVVRSITGQLLRRTTDEVFWWTLLARNRGTMGAIVKLKLYEELSEFLFDHVHKEPEEFLAHLRDVALPRLLSHLETGLIGLSTSAYAGRESRSSLLAELNQVLGSWLCARKTGHLVDPELSRDEPGHDYGVTQLQLEIVASLLNQIYAELESNFSTDPLRLISLRIESTSESVLVKLRITLEAVSQPDYEKFCRRLVAIPVLQNWRAATMRLLPQPITVKVRQARRDVVITLPLWRSKLPAQEEWPWREFYSLVVETPYERIRSEDYAEATTHQLERLLQNHRTELSDYILSQLDGIFAQVYRASRLSIQGVPHTIKNILKHLDVLDFGDVQKLGEVAFGVKKLSELILQGGPVVKRDFDLRQTLEQIVEECRIFYPDVTFEFNDIARGELIAPAAKGHVVVAIWDVIHNNVDAVRRVDEGMPRLVRLFVLKTNDGLEIVIANTGPPTSDSSERGFGIGSMSVKQIIQKQHSGRVEHGAPIYNEEPFQYEWRLLLPLSTPSRRRFDDV